MISRIILAILALPLGLIAWGYCKGFHGGYRFRARHERHQSSRYVLTSDGIQDSHYHDHSAL
jgi:hypothetical protein